MNPDSVLITSGELKLTNLIFNEHEKLLKENDLLDIQIGNYRNKYNYLSKVDSIKSLQIKNYKAEIEDDRVKINDLENQIKKKKQAINRWSIGFITVSTAFIIWLIK